MNIIDCTLRDGGYYNDWNFSNEFINNYLLSLNSTSKISFVEIGYKNLLEPQSSKSFGSCYYTSESFISSIKIPKKINLAVMIDVKKVLHVNEIYKYFHFTKVKSKIKLVRLAVEYFDFPKALIISRILKKIGFKVAINLLKTNIIPSFDFLLKAKLNDFDILYIVDTFGSMSKPEILKIVTDLKRFWSGDLGFHGHDNQHNALSNTLFFLQHGNWADSTISGMGRGAGNVKTEELLYELYPSFNIDKLLKFSEKFMSPLKKIYSWGPNFYYFYSAKNNIHPSLIQDFLSDDRYSFEDRVNLLKFLKHNDSSKKFNKLDQCFYKEFVKPPFVKSNQYLKKSIIIFNNGKGSEEYKIKIKHLLNTNSSYHLLLINTVESFDISSPQSRIVCHPGRILNDLNFYKNDKLNLIIPFSMLPDQVSYQIADKKIIDYSFLVEPDKFIFNKSFSTIPHSLVLAYALAAMTSFKAKEILLAGFDGYEFGDSRYTVNNNILNCYSSTINSLPIFSITDTKYTVARKNILSSL